MNRKERVRSYYEQEYFKFCQDKYENESILDFKYRKQVAQGGFTPDMYDWENCDDDEFQLFEKQRWEKESPSNFSTNLSQKTVAPNSLLQACDRINWFLKHSYGEFIVVKIPIDGIDTFAICIQGYVDDGWDNSCEFMEIYDASGSLIGSAYPPNEDEIAIETWNWQNRAIMGNDFNTPAPEW